MTEPALALEQEAPATAKWRNPYAPLSTLRWVVQAAYLLFFVLVGIEFHSFFRQIVSGGPVTAHRPPAVEGFLPISALVGLKRFLLTGRYDEVHPAGLTILIAAILSSFLARKVFCSWACPVGGISRALEWAGNRTIWRKRKKETLVNRWADRGLISLKYLLLGFFAWAILWKMDLAAIEEFMHTPYNYAADAKMLLFFTDLSGTAAVTLAVLVVLSVVVKHFWCRYLCPYGALLGLVSWMSPQKVVREEATCIDCRACTRACPVEITVHRKASVWTPECTGCLSCVASCPVEDCLTVTRKGKGSLSPYLIPLVGLGTISLLWAAARLTGHWQTTLSLSALSEVYRIASSLVHP
ncbi:MAG TPA: 4Fe-4S binding protein [Candidatus Deferrimicrobiaceae bacterium]|nr:4Fe-4S binding protein [Candidatus Deferrimicrobiaceae bacterium]